MAYTINFNENKKYIILEASGELNLSLLQEIASSVSKIIAQTGCNLILNDLRKAILTKSILDIYKIPKPLNQMLYVL